MTLSIIPTAYKMSSNYLVFFLFPLLLFAQEKETIFIGFKENSLNSFYENEKFSSFNMAPSFFSYRIRDGIGYYSDKNEKRRVKYCEIKGKLISKEEANKKVVEYLEKSAKQRHKEALLDGFSEENAEIIYNVNRYPPIYAFDSYFEKIYIYHIQSETLYEVSWLHSF